ncbi:MAG: hypothetical protein LBU62_07025, partial [Bacteroidales bacterium]|nr:hypothetical protein [Bacteroidales bacterium]
AVFIVLPVSAAMIHATELTNEVACHVWKHVHGLVGILFITVGIFHIVYNWKSLKRYIKIK